MEPPRHRQHREHLPSRREQGRLHVLPYGQRAEGGGDLEGASDAPTRRGARSQTGQLLPVQPYSAGLPAQLAVYSVEAGGLSAPLRTRKSVLWRKIVYILLNSCVSCSF